MHLTVCGRAFFCPGLLPPKLTRIMRLTAILVLAACVQTQASSYGQRVTLDLHAVPLKKAFQEISRQTGLSILYDETEMAKARPVSCVVKDASLEEAMKACLQGQDFDFSLEGGAILIRPKPQQAVALPALPPEVVEGVVLNESGQPLSGASVTVKGTGKTVLTNEKGVFKLKGIQEGAVLTISFVGYAAKELTYNIGAKIEIQLSPAVNQLDRVQVIAYGTTTQRLNTGDVTTVTASTIEKQPVSNPLLALEGQVPGMFITQTSGLPGTSVTVQIRGQNSIANGNDPLYLIDGVPYTSQLLPNSGAVLGFSTNGSSGAVYGSPFSFLNPADIESIDILKDADATAIYGSRGANGVVAITTKKGKAGAMVVNLSVNQGAGVVAHFLDLMNTRQYVQMREEALKNDGTTPTVHNSPDLLFWDTTKYTNFQKEFIGGTAQYTDMQGSVSGGAANTQYYFGGGYHRETTVFPGSFSDQKGSAHMSITSSSADQKFRASFTGSFVVDDNDMPNIDITSRIRLTAPDAPSSFNPDGTLNWSYEPGTQTSAWLSGEPPLAYLLTSYKAITDNLVTNGTLSYKIIDGLEIKTNLGYTGMWVRELAATPLAYYNPTFNASSNAQFVNNSITSWIAEPQINYATGLGKGKLSALLGMTFQQNSSNGQILSASGFSSDALIQDMQAASSVIPQSITNVQYKYNAGYGRINYNWEDKYLLNLSARRDGSSRFGPSNRFHDFGAAGLAWIFSEQPWVKNALPVLSFGKLRGSYGTTGNDQIGDYGYYDLYNTNPELPYEGVSGINPTSLFNPNLQWEVDKKLEAGVNLGFIKDRILLSASYYRNRSSNELLSYSLPQVTGFTSIAANLPAVVQNAGGEFSINTINVKKKNFTWSSAFNVTTYKNKLVAFPNLSTSSYEYSLIIGQSINIKQVLPYAGVDPQNGLYVFKTAKGVDTLTPNYLNDRTDRINVDPKFYGGFDNTFQYKGFKLDIFFQFVKRTGSNMLYNFGWQSVEPGVRGYTWPVQVLNRWQKPGDEKAFEVFSQTYGAPYTQFSSYLAYSSAAYTDVSFIRLKNVSLSYQIPSAWVQHLHIHDLEFYLRGQNLFTLTHHYIGYDPETQNSQGMPTLRVVTGGIKVNL
jgi:TonB-dependent starch-binding outer membrane protein SusC